MAMFDYRHGVAIYDRLGRTIRRSKNLRGLMEHYRKYPDDLVVKVQETSEAGYYVTVYWPHIGDYASTFFEDWRVLLDWLVARRSWSIDRITFDAPLYDKAEPEGRFDKVRKAGIYLTRHAYQH